MTARFGVSRSLLSYYLKRCTENHSDGRLMGFRALIPNSERKAYRSVAEERRVTDMGAGYAGAFQQLLLNYPASARWLEKAIPSKFWHTISWIKHKFFAQGFSYSA